MEKIDSSLTVEEIDKAVSDAKEAKALRHDTKLTEDIRTEEHDKSYEETEDDKFLEQSDKDTDVIEESFEW